MVDMVLLFWDDSTVETAAGKLGSMHGLREVIDVVLNFWTLIWMWADILRHGKGCTPWFVYFIKYLIITPIRPFLYIPKWHMHILCFYVMLDKRPLMYTKKRWKCWQIVEHPRWKSWCDCFGWYNVHRTIKIDVVFILLNYLHGGKSAPIRIIIKQCLRQDRLWLGLWVKPHEKICYLIFCNVKPYV